MRKKASHGMRAATSTLSVSELLLLGEVGYQPLGLVNGSVVVHARVNRPGVTVSTESPLTTAILQHSRASALTRLASTAQGLGAHGVVGVELSREPRDLGSGAFEILATGTAVVGPNASKGVFTAALTGQDFWLLLQTGYEPLGVVTGTCVWHVGRRGAVTALEQVERTEEVEGWTTAVRTAQALATSRMHDQASTIKADGVLGVTLTQTEHVVGRRSTEFLATGTAVRRVRQPADVRPGFVLPL